MPLPVDSLTSADDKDRVRTAISESIQQCISEGGDPEQCKAMVFSKARDKTSGGIRQGLEER